MNQPTAPKQPEPPFDKQDMSPPGLESKMVPRPRYRAPAYKAAGKLVGQKALITGGDSGIGRAVAYLFAREGADVAITCLPEERSDAEQTKKEIEAEGRRAVIYELDARDPEACAQVVKRAASELGGLDILINNGAYQNHVDDVLSVSLEQWDRTFKTNVYGYFYMVRAALPHMHEGATIINTGSITGLEGTGSLLDYASSKGAIHAFTKSLAQALAKKRIRVNCVAPGPVWTPLNPAERSHEDYENFGADQPFERPAQPEEIAPAYVYFASSDSSYVTGEVLTLLGGQRRAG